MEQLVTIKSYAHGFTLILKEYENFDVLLQEIYEKFSKSKQFFGNANVSISFEGVSIDEEQEAKIIACIEEVTDLKVLTIVGKDTKIKSIFDEAYALHHHDSESNDEGEANAFIWRGNIRKGSPLEVSNSLVVIGDVNPGAYVKSNQDIIILGSLFGEAIAGIDGQDGHFIAALEMKSERLSIGAQKYKKKTAKHFWPDSNKKTPKIAVNTENGIEILPITKELLNTLMEY